MNRRWMYLIIAAAIAAVLFTLIQPPATQDEISLKALADEITAGKVKSITINKDQLYIQRSDGSRALSRKEEDVSLLKTLSDLGVPQDKLAAVSIKVQPPSLFDNWWAILGTVLPLIVVVAFFMLIMRQAQGGNNQAIQFARSRARLITGDRPAVTFDDVAGADEAKQE
ncbi:MAG: ATP-dependent metallopeptidase FtsH/Yme1/Tma family protein, partial [Anaerolineae bacterium]